MTNCGLGMDIEWIGCGECDVDFRCYNGECRCIRLPQTTDEELLEEVSPPL